MDRIAFIVPTFNRAKYVTESIAAIRAQMGPQDSLTVIDDGSTDETPSVVRALAGLTYVRQENAGKSAALNRAMAMTDSEYVWICDDDDLLCPGAVDALTARIEETGADFVFGRYTRFRKEGGIREDFGAGYWPELRRGSLVRHILEDAFVMQNAALVRRSAYVKVGPFDETMLRSLDYEMFVRLATQTSSAFVDTIVFEQRKHDGARGPAKMLHSASQSEDVWKKYDRRIFERSCGKLGHAFYKGMFACDNPRLVERAAYLQRASVLARHDLWSEAIADIEAAAAITDPSSLAPIELNICRRSVAGKHGFGGARSGDIPARLRKLLRSGPVGAAIITAMLGGMTWRFRQEETEPKKDALALYRDVAGLRFLPLVGWRKLFGHGRPPADQLTERTEVPLI